MGVLRVTAKQESVFWDTLARERETKASKVIKLIVRRGRADKIAGR